MYKMYSAIYLIKKSESQGSVLSFVLSRIGYLLKQTSTIRSINSSEITFNPRISEADNDTDLFLWTLWCQQLDALHMK